MLFHREKRESLPIVTFIPGNIFLFFSQGKRIQIETISIYFSLEVLDVFPR